MRILIAEDEQRARMGIANLIRHLDGNYEIVGEASNGRTALEMIETSRPDVVITDIKMPYMSGLELVNASREKKCSSRFIIISAYAEFEYAKEALKLGIDDYLLKPPTKEELEKTLKHVEKLIKYGSEARSGLYNTLKDQYPDVHPLIAEVLEIIENGFAGNLNQHQIAAQLDVSPEYLSYLFGKEIGKNFSRFVQEFRIKKAMDLLRNDKNNMKDIPYHVGFTDTKYFNRVFKEIVGESAANFAKKLS
jgi:two-component system response regulator YesN